MNKNHVDKIFSAFIFCWIIGVIISLSLMGGAIWVICHFVNKFW